MAKPAVFLDRDGVLNIEAGYIHHLDDLHLIPGAAEAVRSLNDQGIFCCVIAHQSGPARDHYSVAQIEALQTKLRQLLDQTAGAYLDALYYCPYLSQAAGGTQPDFTQWGTWRKPNTGMLVAAAWEHDLDLHQSFMVGDQAIDIDMAHNAGLKGILLQTSHSKKIIPSKSHHHAKPDYIAKNLTDGVDWILNNLRN